MKLRFTLYTLLTILLCVTASAAGTKRDSLIVSLLTAGPGSEVYELCGHSALRTRSAHMDSVWNYGVFDFNKPNFIYRFVKGETDYILAGYPYRYFEQEYAISSRWLIEQELNLTQEEAWRLLRKLRNEAQPDSCTYRYNYVKDNCATRITDRLSETLGQRILFPDTIGYGTFRDEMRVFHADYPWYQFGIDLALGTGIDYRLSPDEEMFVPVVMARRYATASIEDGRPLVRNEREILPDTGHASLPPTPWYLTPLFISSLLLITSVTLAIYMAVRKKLFPIIYTLWFGLFGIAGCVITFLVFISTHEATNPNMLILWLNPLQLLHAVFVWWRKTRTIANLVAWYNIIVLGVLLIVWPFQAQSANPAFFPLMGATMVLAVAYAILNTGNSFNNKNESHAQGSVYGTGRTGRTHGGKSAGSRRKTPARSRNRR